MKKRFVVVLSMMIAGFLVAPEAFAADATLTGDAYVSSGRSTSNFGAQTNLYVGNSNTSFVQFDLSSLPAGTTVGQIAGATLRLYVNRVNTAGAINVLPVTTAWSEGSITFATIPATGASVGTVQASQAGNYVAVDVTALVQGWVATPATNFGVALASSSADVVLDSKENDQTAHPAELQITLAGPPGAPGAVGAKGVAGPVGPTGPQGTTGLTGATGATGAAGATGPQGIIGLTGAAGPMGAAGAAGATGPQGIIGLTGAAGPMGTAGAAGATGPQGIIGLTGAAGAAGPQGVIGLTGVAGPTGTAGATGATGPQGIIGLTGAAGPMGAAGAAGPQGTIGLTGTPGTNGAAGPAGPQGPVANFMGAWVSSTTYHVGDAVSETGSSYVALGTNSDIDPATDVAGPGTTWALLASKGTAGTNGNDGATGSQGIQGIQGIQGSQGVPGSTGETGMTGATGGTGLTGAPGANGTDGTTGPAGPQGPVANFMGAWVSSTTYHAGDAVSETGSSYVALGTNSDVDPATDVAGPGTTWAVLASQGVAGTNGSDGAVGSQGIQGVQGFQGPMGATGTTGDTGSTGATGGTGLTGAPGANGADGAAGPAGPQGPVANFLGTYVDSSTYHAGDAVSEDGSSYVALMTSSGVDPAKDVTNSGGNWALLASQGAAGTNGNDGATGSQGIQGVQGFQGPMGATGSTGDTGATGATGGTGLTGAPGANGADGAAGPAGPQGPVANFMGAWVSSTTYHAGDAVSETGSSYVALGTNNNIDPATDVTNSGGNWALLASQGAAGTNGSDGATGSQGVQGFQGPMGATGSTGDTGATGATGGTGLTGAPGANGADGAAGPAGPQGPVANFLGAWVSSTTYHAGDAVSETGSSYVALGTNNNIDPATDVTNSGGNWALLASQGAAGTNGSDGATGSQGIQGVQGFQGPMGATGSTGDTGATGATGGTGLTGAPGANGADGAAGPTGPQGPVANFMGAWVSSTTYHAGDAVSETGSSYVALGTNNNIDPATDVTNSGGNWALLASQGAAGTNGSDGATGSQGVQGFQGPMGATGSTGDTGATGATGGTGLTGAPGANGADGAAGPAGPQGPVANFMGAWVSSTTYHAGDAVSETGSSYVALGTNNNIDPATDVTNSGGNWALLASQGAAGTNGSDGATGSQGVQGFQGPMGATGSTGDTGATGATGGTGLTGAPGTNGADGAAGPAGPQGPVANFMGAWVSSTTYHAGDAVSETGSSYVALGTNNNIDPATDVMNSGGNWAVLANKGDTGADGAPGAQGAMGVQGPQGLQGNAGADGAPGAQGVAGSTGPQGPVANFMGAWASGSMYAIGDAVSENGSSYVALAANTATDPAADVANSGGNWAVLAKGAGAIPSTAVMQTISSNIYYNPLQSGQSSAAASDNTFAWVPVGCTITALQVWSRDSGDDSLVVDLQSSPNAGGSAPSDTLYSCTVSAGSPASCGTPEEGPLFIPAGTFLTLNITIDGTNPPAGSGVIWTSFGCQ